MRAGDLTIRDAEPSEIDALTTIWFDGWRDAHADILPAEFVRHRTWESLRERMEAALDTVRVAVLSEVPVGFTMIRKDELYQLYVAAPARGSGAAATLVADAIASLRAAGVKTAWLDCAIGNERAARFYEKSGWRRVGVVASRHETPDGVIALDVWRYDYELGP